MGSVQMQRIDDVACVGSLLRHRWRGARALSCTQLRIQSMLRLSCRLCKSLE
jgi:hypothetical protein